MRPISFESDAFHTQCFQFLVGIIEFPGGPAGPRVPTAPLSPFAPSRPSRPGVPGLPGTPLFPGTPAAPCRHWREVNRIGRCNYQIPYECSKAGIRLTKTSPISTPMNQESRATFLNVDSSQNRIGYPRRLSNKSVDKPVSSTARLLTCVVAMAMSGTLQPNSCLTWHISVKPWLEYCVLRDEWHKAHHVTTIHAMKLQGNHWMGYNGSQRSLFPYCVLISLECGRTILQLSGGNTSLVILVRWNSNCSETPIVFTSIRITINKRLIIFEGRTK